MHADAVGGGSAFSFIGLVKHLVLALVSTALMVYFAFSVPWHGGAVPESLSLAFAATSFVTALALIQGYYQLHNRGLHGFWKALWYVAVTDSILLGTAIAAIGLALTGSQISFPGEEILTAPDLFFLLTVFQTIYFLAASVQIMRSVFHENVAQNWYSATLFMVIALNTAAVIVGPLFI